MVCMVSTAVCRVSCTPSSIGLTLQNESSISSVCSCTDASTTQLLCIWPTTAHQFRTLFSTSACVQPAAIKSPFHATGSVHTAVGLFLLLVRQSGTHCLKTCGLRSVLWTVADRHWRHFYFRSTSMFSALEVCYENALYKFTFDTDIDIWPRWQNTRWRRISGANGYCRITCVYKQLNTCSAAVGSRSNIACAARLFLTVIAATNGVAPVLSLILRLSAGWESNNEIIVWCWFSIATCSGVFPSTSLTHKYKSAKATLYWPNHISLSSWIIT